MKSLQYACPEQNLDFSGNDIGSLSPDAGVPDWEQCGVLCNIFPTCSYWTYNKDGWCFLKSSDGGVRPDDGCYSGTRDCPGLPTIQPPTVKSVFGN